MAQNTKNKRNIKDINILTSHKLNIKNKNLLKNRYKIEFTNNRLDRENMLKHIFLPNNIRYDKFGVNYVYLAAIDLIAKN